MVKVIVPRAVRALRESTGCQRALRAACSQAARNCDVPPLAEADVTSPRELTVTVTVTTVLLRSFTSGRGQPRNFQPSECPEIPVELPVEPSELLRP